MTSIKNNNNNIIVKVSIFLFNFKYSFLSNGSKKYKASNPINVNRIDIDKHTRPFILNGRLL